MPADSEPATTSALAALERRVGVLEARDAIRRQLDRYALAVDTRDRATLLDLFTADVAFIVTTDQTWRRGREQLWAYLADLLAPHGPTLHHAVGSIEVEVEDDDPDRAASRHLGFAWHAREEGLEVAALTYDHTWRRAGDGRWRISHRIITPWWTCRAADLLETGWDPAAATGQPDVPTPWLPWCSSTFSDRVDRATRPGRDDTDRADEQDA